ncbi:WbqC family protein [Minwuia sp.]|uniref:WbqC family protein n=1 Tax=Minwuia sp. TaxID=2493630 RepID=UPI003A95D2B4
MTHIVAIHQPNFFPWLGYFDKIRRADTFVFLDAVDYPRSGSKGMGSWTNRVRIDVQGQPHWINCPLQRLGANHPINAYQIDDRQPWRKKLLKTLRASYGRSPNFDDAFALLEPLIADGPAGLADFNIAAIKTLAGHLGCQATFVRQSEMAVEGKATALLIALVKSAGGDAYLAGGGADGYQEDGLFAEKGVDLVYQNFSPAPYGPAESYLPGLSVIDYLMRDGSPLSAREQAGDQ